MPTEPPFIKKERNICVWCGYPGSVHKGGYRKPNGTIGEVSVCCEDHFDRWLIWQSSLAPIKEQQHITSFKGVQA